MDRGAWRATVHGVAESDTAEQPKLSWRHFRDYERSVDYRFGIPSTCILTMNFYAKNISSEVPLWTVGLYMFSTDYFFMLPSCILHCVIEINLCECRDPLSSSSHSFSLLWIFFISCLFKKWIFSCPFIILQRTVEEVLGKFAQLFGSFPNAKAKTYLSAIQKIIQIVCCTQKPWK